MKKAKTNHNQFAIRAFPPELEKETRELHELVLCGAEPLLRSWEHPAEMMRSKVSRRAFFCAAHQGFHKAQNNIIAAIFKDHDNPLPDATMAMYRKLMDCVAWQMLEMQLYAARRLYQSQRPPSLKHSNFNSVKSASDFETSEDHAKFALISDLTSFVQVGDLLVYDADKGLAVVEVKEGEKNKGETRDTSHISLAEKWGSVPNFPIFLLPKNGEVSPISQNLNQFQHKKPVKTKQPSNFGESAPQNCPTGP